MGEKGCNEKGDVGKDGIIDRVERESNQGRNGRDRGGEKYVSV